MSLGLPAASPAPSATLIDRLWPPASAVSGWLRIAVIAVAGVAALALSARIAVPLPPVPMTLQTAAVLTVGAICGAGLGSAIVLLYLAAGALGVPVLAGGAAGLAALTGPTAGFLAGFVVAAALAGALCGHRTRNVWRLLAVMATGHAVIVLLGYLWLAFGADLGPAKAWRVGVSPFLAGAAVKAVLAAAVVGGLQRLAARREI